MSLSRIQVRQETMKNTITPQIRAVRQHVQRRQHIICKLYILSCQVFITGNWEWLSIATGH